MKNRFSNIDLVASIAELRDKFVGMRVANIYDIDNKTYLIRLQKPDFKAILLLESGNRLNFTDFEWPKNMSPSGFSMKLRKHIRSRRLESIGQLGIDRIVDMTFGSNEAAYHVIIELYDRGNIVLTDCEYTILNILRPRTDNNDQSVRFAVREKYPLELAKQKASVLNLEELNDLLNKNIGNNLKRVLTQNLEYGPAVMDHCLLLSELNGFGNIGDDMMATNNVLKLHAAILEAEKIISEAKSGLCKGFIIQKREKKAKDDDILLTYNEYHPFLFKQHETQCYVEFESFNKAVDEFYSKLESQKLELKVLQQEKAALKKLENVKLDHQKRINELQKEQNVDHQKGYMIEINLSLVDKAINVIQSAIANQIDWGEIQNIVAEAQSENDPVAKCIKKLKLDSNQISLQLFDPYDDEIEIKTKPLVIDIDLNLTAHANSRKYYVDKKHASLKEQKTVSASSVALKSAERKTKEALKEVTITANINKIRKTYWFEKFLWFISSENYLIIGGRDQQQNEMIVKKYFNSGDVYVHADLHGACSIVIKNQPGSEIPPKTLNEAGTMAICNSAAWDAKIVTSAWWVYHNQVSKTAPTGEYLSTGSFMIRGKKNYLPPCYLVYGFGFLFKLDDDSVARHKGERQVRNLDFDDLNDDNLSGTTFEEFKYESKDVDSSSEVIDDMASLSLDIKCKDSDENLISSVIDMNPSENIDVNHFEYPDTCLDLLGGKSQESLELSHSNIYFGNDKPVIIGSKVSKTGSKLSAKQKRDLRKQNKSVGSSNQECDEIIEDENKNSIGTIVDEVNIDVNHGTSESEILADNESVASISDEMSTKDASVKQQHLKRGQKAKLKKIKEKYKDQDDEERAFRMEILASSGNVKTDKKNKKSKVLDNDNIAKNNQQKKYIRPDGLPARKLEISDIKVETPTVEDTTDLVEVDNNVDDLKKPDVNSDNEQDDVATDEVDFSILDTFTAIPHEEDILLYSIPVCSPYSTMTQYKFKIKLTPGTTKRGKAAKSALNMFMLDKSTSNREKELLKVTKDTDLSRNMPGKVKISAPNLHKHKQK